MMSFICALPLLPLHCSLLSSAGEEVVRLQELEGNTVTLHTGITAVQSDAQILWFYEKGDIKIVNSQVIRGETVTDYNRERYGDRLQLDRSSASLTIRNISRENSGLYKLQIIAENRSFQNFNIECYAPVSMPVINQTEKCSRHPKELSSFLCSVENGKDVNLSWYEGNERISSISNDSSEHLYLPLNITNIDISTLTCVAANPVSNQTTQLTECDDQNTGVFYLLLAVPIVTAAVKIWVWKKKNNQQDPPERNMQYSAVAKNGPSAKTTQMKQ